jgi:hypothetical protein
MNASLIVGSSTVLVAATALAATQLAEMRVTPIEVDAMQAHDAGTSGVAGISGPTDTVYVKQSDAPKTD